MIGQWGFGSINIKRSNTLSTLLFCTNTQTCSLYSCATYLLNFIITPSVILGQIRSSAELSPVAHCYAALSHTWLDSPLVLPFQPPTPLFSHHFCFHFLSATFFSASSSRSPAIRLHTASSHARLQSPLIL